MAGQSVDDGPVEASQSREPTDGGRRGAASSIANAALGLLGCNACKVFVYDEHAGSYVSIASAGDGDGLPASPPISAEAVAGLFDEGEIVQAADDTRMLPDSFVVEAQALSAASMLALHLASDRHRLGLVLCAYRIPRMLSAAGRYAPASFARLASGALDLARRCENALDRADRLAALLDSAARFAGELDLEELFTAIYDEVARHMDAPSFFVALETPETRELRTEYAIDSGNRLHGDALPGGAALANQVHESGQPLLTETNSADVRSPDVKEVQSGTTLIVPMRLGQRIIGVMAAQSKLPNAYGPHHIEFLAEVAEQAATAIQNAGVLREERRRIGELTMLHRVAVLTSSEAQLDRIMAAVVVEATSTFHADAASIALENEQGDFSLAATFGLSEEYRKKRRLSGAMLRALYGDPPKERFVGPDQLASIGQVELEASEGIRSVFFIPLVYRGRLVGSLSLHGRQSIVRLSSSESRLAQVFADQVAAAMHRAQAAQTLAERIEDYDLITLVGRALVSSLQVDYGAVLQILRDHLGYGHLAIFSVDSDPPRLQLQSSLGYYKDAWLEDVKVERNLFGSVVSDGQMLYVPDVTAEPRCVTIAQNLRSFIAYPLKVENKVLGVLSVESAKIDAFVARDRRILAGIADQTAVAMSNARQYATATERLASLDAARAKAEEHAQYLERGQEELKLLSAVGAAVNSTLNLTRMLATAAEKIAEGLHAERCAISMYNEEQSETEIVADCWTVGSPTLVGARFPIRRESDVLKTIKQHRSIVSVDVPADGRFDGNRQEVLEQQLRGCAIAAILSEGQMMGTVTVAQTSAPRQFTSEQVGVLETIATQLALGVRNARLYGRARERANEDSLTGLFNHRYLHGRMEQELVRTQRTGLPLAIVLFDLNNFKSFNDNYGHQSGDEVLRFMATVLNQSLRVTDIAGRYGGDEFLIILPQSDEQGAKLLLERVRQKITEQAQGGFLPIPIELSAGIAVYPRDGENKRDLIACADAAMYADKRK